MPPFQVFTFIHAHSPLENSTLQDAMFWATEVKVLEPCKQDDCKGQAWIKFFACMWIAFD